MVANAGYAGRVRPDHRARQIQLGLRCAGDDFRSGPRRLLGMPERWAPVASEHATVVENRRLPAPVTESWDWQLRAACRNVDSAYFFHPHGERGVERDRREAHAKAICRSCPVIAACREHALAAGEPYGIWGGMSRKDREGHTLRSS